MEVKQLHSRRGRDTIFILVCIFIRNCISWLHESHIKCRENLECARYFSPCNDDVKDSQRN